MDVLAFRPNPQPREQKPPVGQPRELYYTTTGIEGEMTLEDHLLVLHVWLLEFESITLVWQVENKGDRIKSCSKARYLPSFERLHLIG